MRILILTRSYAPRESPRAYRWTALAEDWARRGHRVQVVCARSEDAGDSGTRNGVDILRVGPPDANRSNGTVRASIPGRIPFRKFLGSAWAAFRWPDDACLWGPPAALAARKLLREGGYDSLVSVSDPFTSHLAALTAHRVAPRIPWLADVGDPFSLLVKVPRNNRRLYRSLNTSLESQVFSRCTAATFTSQETKLAYSALYPSATEKFSVIGPLIPTPSIPEGTSPFPADGRIRLVFCGTLDRRTRDPGYLLRLFRRLSETPDLGPALELHFFGRISDTERSFEPFQDLLGTRIFRHGPVPRPVAQQAVRAADVLVSIGFDEEPLQLPSKVVEYAASTRPVIDLYSDDRDLSHRFFSAYGAALPVRARPGGPHDADVSALADFIRRRPAPSPEALDSLLAPHRLESVSGAYLALLARAAQR